METEISLQFLVINVVREPSWTIVIKSALNLKYHFGLQEMIKFPRNGYFPQKNFILFSFYVPPDGTSRTSASASNKTDHSMALRNWTF